MKQKHPNLPAHDENKQHFRVSSTEARLFNKTHQWRVCTSILRQQNSKWANQITKRRDSGKLQGEASVCVEIPIYTLPSVVVTVHSDQVVNKATVINT